MNKDKLWCKIVMQNGRIKGRVEEPRRRGCGGRGCCHGQPVEDFAWTYVVDFCLGLEEGNFVIFKNWQGPPNLANMKRLRCHGSGIWAWKTLTIVIVLFLARSIFWVVFWISRFLLVVLWKFSPLRVGRSGTEPACSLKFFLDQTSSGPHRHS